MKPAVIAHRGASGYRPEHTLAAYRLAIEQGADFIEPDLVLTRDGVLVARHDNDLSASTDVADHPEFSARRCRKRIDGDEREGWFCEDFLLAELRTLRAREPLPQLRPANTAYDGQWTIPTLAEILDLVRQAERQGRRVGIYPETKHPTWFAHEGRYHDGLPIQRSLGALLLAQLAAHGFTDPDRVYIQSFELANLIELQHSLMPAAGLCFPLVQLLGDLEHGQPYDVAWNVAQGNELAPIYGALAHWAARSNGAGLSYRSLTSPAGLIALRQSHASGVGPPKDSLLPSGADAAPAPWLANALAAGLAVHPYTLRRETGAERELPRLLALGITGFFIDQPDLGVCLRDHYIASLNPP